MSILGSNAQVSPPPAGTNELTGRIYVWPEFDPFDPALRRLHRLRGQR